MFCHITRSGFVCRLIVDKIDVNGDGEVTEQELIDWIKKAQSKYLEEEVQSQWEVSTANWGERGGHNTPRKGGQR